MFRILLKALYFPALYVFILGVEVTLNGTDYDFRITIMLMLTAVFISFLTERVIPYNENWNQPVGDRVRDFMHFMVNESMNYVFILILPFATIFAPFPTIWPVEWALIWQLLLAIVIFDFASTLFHFISHRVNFFWRVHSIHHIPNRLYGLNGIMKHPLFQIIDGIVAAGPLWLVGIPREVALLLIMSIFIQLLIQHSNTDMKTGVFNHIFATAEVHRFHHLKGKSGDVNFGLFFSLWDQLMGTFYFSKLHNLSSDEIGLTDSDIPNSYWDQIKRPFKNR